MLPLVRFLNRHYREEATLSACGDVNRNVMCNPNPHLSEVHAEVLDVARKISDHLTPQTRAYHEIWLDGERVADFLGHLRSARRLVIRARDIENRRFDMVFRLDGVEPALDHALTACASQVAA